MIDASSLYQKLVFSYVRFQEFKRSISKKHEVHFSTRELIYMHDLLVHPNSTISECAQRAKVTLGTYTTVYKLLVKKGFVTIAEKAKDKRVKIITLTAKGEKIVRAYLAAFQKMIDELVLEMGESRFKDFALFLDRATQVLEAETKKNS